MYYLSDIEIERLGIRAETFVVSQRRAINKFGNQLDLTKLSYKYRVIPENPEEISKYILDTTFPYHRPERDKEYYLPDDLKRLAAVVATNIMELERYNNNS